MDWDSKAGLYWKIEESQVPFWDYTDSIMTAWKSRIKSTSKECTIKILADQIKIINNSLATYGTAES
jgi:hypothetical protein